VMSVRYPYDQLNDKSARYVNAVMRFMGSDLDNKDVLDIGCGVGRLSKQIVKVARKLTCIDLSDRMMTRCKSVLDRDRARRKRGFDRHKARLPDPEYF